MDTTSDDLTRPLGVGGPKVRVQSWRWLARATIALCSCAVVGALGYVQFFGDPLGGVPHATVDIVARPKSQVADAPRTPEPPALPAGQTDPARQAAVDVEKASGVSVLRPSGTAAPASIIVRIPDEVTLKLNPAADSRLVERTRFGALPRMGPDGAKALDVYARPVAGLPGGARPVGRVAIVVGGLGISQTATADALTRLPPPVTLAFAPYGADLERLATRARDAGHEIMLQVPMEPFDYPDSDPGPHTLTTAARPQENLEHLQWAMGRFGGYVGLVNYMGGKLTADERALAPILREAGARGLGFLDDGSSSRSLVMGFKGETRVARAEIVLDAAPRADLIDKALQRLEATAATGAIAVGTATALPLSIERIARWAAGLEGRGILLVPASAALRAGRRDTAGQ